MSGGAPGPLRLTKVEVDEVGDRVVVSVEGPGLPENPALAAGAPRTLGSRSRTEESSASKASPVGMSRWSAAWFDLPGKLELVASVASDVRAEAAPRSAARAPT